MSIAMTINASHKSDDVEEMTALTLHCCVSYLSFIRVVVFSIHQKDMLYMIETMRNDWIDSSYEERAILRKKCLFAYRLSKYFITMVMTTATLFALMPIFEMNFLSDVERTLPFHYFEMNQTASPIFECLYFFDTIAGVSTVCTISSATSFNLVVVIHGSAKFAILQRRLEMMNKNDPDIDRVIVNCVRRHQDAIVFADALESILNLLVLGQFVLSIGLICFAGFQITSTLQSKIHLLKYLFFIVAAILELFMFSSSGNKLIIESDAVSESAYRSDWIGSTFSRNLHIMMIRSRIPSRVTIGKFCDMSLRSFTQVLSTSFSYLMVLMTTTMSEE